MPSRAVDQDPFAVVYVMGWGRSGSTILDSMLGQIDGFVSIGEFRWVWEQNIVLNRQCGCGAEFSRCELWSQVLDALPVDLKDRAMDVDRRLRRVSGDLAVPSLLLRKWGGGRAREPEDELIRAFYGEIARVSRARYIVDSSKVPGYGAYLAKRVGLDVRFVHIVRDPRAVAYSWTKTVQQSDVGSPMPKRRPADSAMRWVVRNAEAEAVGRFARRPYLRVRYEDLISSPRSVLSEIAGFVGVPNAQLPLVDDHTVRLNATHTSTGNPSRFRTGDVALRLDSEWRHSFPARSKATVSLITGYLRRIYGYAH